MRKALSYTITFDRWLFSQNIIRTAVRQSYTNLVHTAEYVQTEERLIDRTKEEFKKEIIDGGLIIRNHKTEANSFDLFIETVSKAIDINPDIELIVKLSETDWYSKEYIQKLVDLSNQTSFDYTSQDNESFIINEFVGYKPVEKMDKDLSSQTMAISRKAFDYLRTHYGKIQCDNGECRVIYGLLKQNPEMKILLRKNDGTHIMFQVETTDCNTTTKTANS